MRGAKPQAEKLFIKLKCQQPHHTVVGNIKQFPLKVTRQSTHLPLLKLYRTILKETLWLNDSAQTGIYFLVQMGGSSPETSWQVETKRAL